MKDLDLRPKPIIFRALSVAFISLFGGNSCAKEPEYIGSVLSSSNREAVIPTWQGKTVVVESKLSDFHLSIRRFADEVGFKYERREIKLSKSFTEVILSKNKDAIVIENYRQQNMFSVVFFLESSSESNLAIIERYKSCCLNGYDN